MDFAWQRRDIDHRAVIFTQRKTTKCADTFVYADIKLAIALDTEAKRMLPTLWFLGFDRREYHWTRSLEYVVGNISRAFPKFGFLYLRPDRIIIRISLFVRSTGILGGLIALFRAFNLRLFFSL